MVAATVLAGIFGGPLAAIPAVALALYLLVERRLVVRREETEALLRKAAQQRESAANTDASSAGAAPQAGATRPRTNSGVVRDPARSSQRAAGGRAPAPQAPSPAQPSPVRADALRVAGSPASVAVAEVQQLLAELQQWASDVRRQVASPRFEDSIRTRSPELDLRGLGLSDVPMVLKKFTWVKEVKVSRAFLRANGNTSGTSPVSSPGTQPLDRAAVKAALQVWQRGEAGSTDEQINFFLDCFDRGESKIDLRGANLKSIPAVVADFPQLRTISSSVGFLFRRGR